MNWRVVASDQLYDWSEGLEPIHGFGAAEEARSIGRAATCVRRGSAGHVAREIQAVRETWLQLRRRIRPWSEVLPICEPSQCAPGNAVRPVGVPGAGGSPGRELPRSPECDRPGLRDQSGTTETSRGVRVAPHAAGNYRGHRGCRCVGGEHDLRIAGGRARTASAECDDRRRVDRLRRIGGTRSRGGESWKQR